MFDFSTKVTNDESKWMDQKWIRINHFRSFIILTIQEIILPLNHSIDKSSVIKYHHNDYVLWVIV